MVVLCIYKSRSLTLKAVEVLADLIFPRKTRIHRIMFVSINVRNNKVMILL